LPSALPAPNKPAPAEGSGPAAAWHAGLPWGLLAVAFGAGIVMTVPGIYFSFHFESIGLGKTSTVANLMMLNSAIAAVFSATFGMALAKSTQKLVLGGACAAMAIGLAVLAYAPGAALAAAAMLLMGAGMGWLAPALPALAVERAAEGQRGKLVGAVQGIASVAPLLGVTLAEPLLPAYGTQGALLAIAALAAVLIVPFALGRRN
jgi:MFS family permease